MTTPIISAKVFKRWRALGFTDADLARMLSVEAGPVGRACDTGHQPQREGRADLAVLEAVRAHLRATFTTIEAARTWLHADSRYLGGLKPADVLRAGRPDRVEAALNALDLGVFV